MLKVFTRWVVLAATLLAGAVGIIRARPYDSHGLEAMLSMSLDCAAPCWQGIRPGDTSGPAALALVDQMVAVRDLDSHLDIYPGQIFWHWRDEDPALFANDGQWAYIWLERDVVSSIFLPSFRHYADLYLLLGPPETIVIFSDSTLGLGPVVYLSVYPNQTYVSSFIHCRSRAVDLWNAPTNIHLGQRPEYEGAIQRVFRPSELRGWLPDRLCLRG